MTFLTVLRLLLSSPTPNTTFDSKFIPPHPTHYIFLVLNRTISYFGTAHFQFIFQYFETKSRDQSTWSHGQKIKCTSRDILFCYETKKGRTIIGNHHRQAQMKTTRRSEFLFKKHSIFSRMLGHILQFYLSFYRIL